MKKRFLFLSTLVSLILSSCGTMSSYYAQFEDGIYYRPDDSRAVAAVSANELRDLQQETDNAFITSGNNNVYELSDDETYESRLRKFDSPTYTIYLDLCGWDNAWYNPWWGTYNYGWYYPWSYRGWYGWNDPWYYGWYDPWYYGSWYGYGYGYSYYNPWYYNDWWYYGHNWGPAPGPGIGGGHHDGDHNSRGDFAYGKRETPTGNNRGIRSGSSYVRLDGNSTTYSRRSRLNTATQTGNSSYRRTTGSGSNYGTRASSSTPKSSYTRSTRRSSSSEGTGSYSTSSSSRSSYNSSSSASRSSSYSGSSYSGSSRSSGSSYSGGSSSHNSSGGSHSGGGRR